MWSAQAVRELKKTTLNAIYPPCAEPEARNSAVGWHWNTHIYLWNIKIILLIEWPYEAEYFWLIYQKLCTKFPLNPCGMLGFGWENFYAINNIINKVEERKYINTVKHGYSTIKGIREIMLL